MKNLKLIGLFTGLFGVFAASSQASHKIEVCVIPLENIVHQEAQGFVGSLQHMFVRGTENGTVTGLNFEPIDKNNGWLLSASMIGNQNYTEATCADLLNVDSPEIYTQVWDAIVQGYSAYASMNPYRVAGSNCQDATKKVLSDLGHEIPAALAI